MWRVVAVAALVALVAGTVATAVAGARRTETSVDRYVAAGELPDATLEIDEAALAKHPELADAVLHSDLVVRSYAVKLVLGQLGDGAEPVAIAFGNGVPRVASPIVLEGRAPRLGRSHEVVIDETMAHRRRLRVGDDFRFRTFAPDQDPSREIHRFHWAIRHPC